MKYTIPAATECGMFSGIKLLCCIRMTTNLQTFVSSALTFNLLQ